MPKPESNEEKKDRIELVAGVIRRGNLFRDQLLVHLPHDELPVAEQRCAIGGRIEFRFEADTRPPQHHRRVQLPTWGGGGVCLPG